MMKRRSRPNLRRSYLRGQVQLRERCNKLTNRQRQIIVYGLILIYIVCSIWMVVQLFLPQWEEPLFIPKGTLMDSQIPIDTLHKETVTEQHLAMNDYGE